MEPILPFLSAAGLGGIIGAVVTTFLQSWLSRRTALGERRFREKKDAYVNLLYAMHRSEIEAAPEAAKLVDHWTNVIDLVGSNAVRRCCLRIRATNPLPDGGHHPDRPQALADLKSAMRADLGIDIEN
jgi:hypothetical protein